MADAGITVVIAPWQRALGGAEESAVRALLKRAGEIDGVAPFSGHVIDAIDREPGAEADDYALAFFDEVLVGIAVIHGSDPGEVAVDPPYRRNGVGSALLKLVLAKSARVWAHGDLPAGRALAEQHGLVRTRELLQYRRPDSPVATAVWPDGVAVRTFQVGQDEEAFLGVNSRAFAWHPEQGRLDHAGLAAEMSEDWFDPAGFFLAVDSDDRVLGFHWTKIHGIDGTPGTGPITSIGEIYVLAVDPKSGVRGLGTPLSLVGLKYLQNKGLRAAMLYVEGDNTAAIKLYERLGFRPYLADVVYSLPS